MIKLKQILSESAWNRKFGEPLPTLKDVIEKKNDSVNEGLSLIHI